MKARIMEMLQRIPIFGGVTDEALEHILDKAQSVSVGKGEFFCREGDPAESMFVLVDGRVAILKAIEGREYELSHMEPGDCFGELELIDLRPRAASVRAEEDCQAIEISGRVLHEVYKIDQTSFAMIHMNMGREVSRRLRALDGELLKIRGASADGGAGDTLMDSTPTDARAEQHALRCKVCTKHMQPDEERWEVWHGDAKYVVCCPLCRERFKEKPELYLVT